MLFWIEIVKTTGSLIKRKPPGTSWGFYLSELIFYNSYRGFLSTLKKIAGPSHDHIWKK